MTANAVLDELATIFPQASLATHAEGLRELTFPRLNGNDYWFHMVAGPRLLQVGAWLGEVDGPQPSFWYMPFESDSFAQDAEHFRRVSLDVLLRRTRITQARGMLFCTFLCEALCEGVWTRVYKNGYLRLTIRDLPRIPGRRHVYTADKTLIPTRSASSEEKG